MKFIVYIDREGTTGPTPNRPPGEPIIIDVTPETQFGDAVGEALHAAGKGVEELYRSGDKGPFYWPWLLRVASDPESGLVQFPRVAIAEDGQFLWTWGARDWATLADYERARKAGFFDGDPLGVFLERPMYGDGVIPGWDEFLRWLEEGAVIGMATWLVSFLRRHLARWRDRGASTPFAFLDIVVARDAWDREELRRLLGISEREASELLTALGFTPIDQIGRTRWVVSDDPDAVALRKKILRDFMHHPDERE